ncbi:MAG: hypothetical protein EPO07_00485 [Verrucomicrobia bacterium]|nr:MAG: hypothetical protein EPO07_00485 [Verrucomicrobiota bacterium]
MRDVQLILGVMLAGFATILCAAAANGASAPQLSYGLDEIAKLNKAGTDQSVIVAYVENSPTAYRATADDIIQLREAGVSSAVLTAIMRHGSELRARAAQSQTATATVAAQPAVVAAPAFTYVAPEVYSPPTVSVVYVGSYPSYGCSYGWYGYSGCYGYPRYSSCYYPRFNACYPRFNSCSFPARSTCFAPRVRASGAFAPRFSVGASFGGGHRGGFVSGGFHRR